MNNYIGCLGCCFRHITKNGEGDLVVMDVESFTRREKMLRLREELVAVEEDRAAGRMGCSPDDLDAYLDDIIREPLKTSISQFWSRSDLLACFMQLLNYQELHKTCCQSLTPPKLEIDGF